MIKRLTPKKKWQTNKIFSDQQEIAIRLSDINIKSRQQFQIDCEKSTGKVPEKSRFPNILQIYERFSLYDSRQQIDKSTPKKISSKIEQLDTKYNSGEKDIEEDKENSELALSDVKLNKLSKQEIAQKAQLDIENKITEANNLSIKNQEKKKRENSGNTKTKNISPTNKQVAREGAGAVHMHHNPHIQIKDSRVREGEDKRAISSDRQNHYLTTPQSPSARQPTTAEKYTLFGHSDHSTL